MRKPFLKSNDVKEKRSLKYKIHYFKCVPQIFVTLNIKYFRIKRKEKENDHRRNDYCQK